MALKLPQAYETEVYVTDGGYVAIKQPDDGRGDDTVVLLTASQLGPVIEELRARLNDREEWESLGVVREEETESECAGEVEEDAGPTATLDDEIPTTPPH